VCDSCCGSLPCQFSVGEATVYALREGFGESRAIVVADLVVEPEHLLIEITVEMHRLYGNIGAVQPTLEQAPEVLNCLRVDAASGHIGFHVVHGLVDELLAASPS
jgi:hypothetical protein